MRKYLIVLLSSVYAALCNAQILVSPAQLENTKWELTSRKIGSVIEYQQNGDILRLTFTRESIIYYKYYGALDESNEFTHSYYMSPSVPSYSNFNYSNIGKDIKGEYMVYRNPKTGRIDYYTVSSYSNNELVLFHKVAPNTIGARDVYLRYKRIK